MSTFLRGGDTFQVFSVSSTINGTGDVLRVYNNTAEDAYIRTGVGTQTASSSDIVVPANSVAFIQIGFDADNAASQGAVLAMRGTLV